LTEAFTREKYPSAFIEIDAVEDAGLTVLDDMAEFDEQIEGLDIELEDYKRRIENLDATLEEDTDLTEEQSAAYRNVASAITTAADAMKDATDGLFDAEPAMEENITLTEEMVEAYTSMAESVIKAVDSMASGWGRAERVGTQSARTTVRNLKSQLDQLNQYNEQLDILRDSGYFSEEMLALLASGGAENMAVTAGFAKEVQRAQKGNASSVENLEAASSYYEQLAAAKADLAETMLEMKLTVDEDSLSGAIVTGMSGLALNVNVNASALADALTPFISANIARDNTTSGKTGG
jgi:chromosome segregation ATPase